MIISPLLFPIRCILLVLSFFLVAFGQPAWSSWVGLISSCVGFALFWRILLDIPKKSTRFLAGMFWFAGVQIIQLSWMAYHPFLYIYGVILFCAFMGGSQFGIIALLIQPKAFNRFTNLLFIACLWTLFEWSRLFVLSGLSFNPVGIALSTSLYSLQFASLGGVYFLSFWIILTNLIILKAWLNKYYAKDSVLVLILILMPYLFGLAHLQYHSSIQSKNDTTLSAVLIQPAFPIEENQLFVSAEEMREFVMEEWRIILSLAQKHQEKTIDLLVLPEYVVPFGTYHPVFSANHVKRMFENIFGKSALSQLPPLEEPYAALVETSEGVRWLVSNAFLAQALANILQTDLVIGLEDSVYVNQKKSEAFSSAFHFTPNNGPITRYDKRVLVPMGEYIPFDFCRKIAADYGITGSFTCGESAKVFKGKVPFSPSICYEETYGHLIREGRKKGAELLVNLTNDGWFPESLLPRQHFDHARLRTVENGIPLLRACNTGVTSSIDSLGRIVAVLDDHPVKMQSIPDSLHTTISTYHYPTLYAQFGDLLIIGFCLITVGLGIFKMLWHK